MLNYKSMKKSHLEKPTFIEVGLTVQTPRRDLVSAYVDVVVLPEQASYYAAKGVDLVSLLDSSLSSSLDCFFPSRSIVSVDVRIIDPSLSSVPLSFRGRDTYDIAANLAGDILGQIL